MNRIGRFGSDRLVKKLDRIDRLVKKLDWIWIESDNAKKMDRIGSRSDSDPIVPTPGYQRISVQSRG
jgi:hypothetical protein